MFVVQLTISIYFVYIFMLLDTKLFFLYWWLVGIGLWVFFHNTWLYYDMVF